MLATNDTIVAVTQNLLSAHMLMYLRDVFYNCHMLL